MLVDFAYKQNVTVEFVPNLEDQGRFYPDFGMILLREGMSELRTVSVLAHELGHAFHGDSGVSVFREKRAWDYAAKLLIDRNEFESVTAVYDEPYAVARELEVLPDVVEAAWRVYATKVDASTDSSNSLPPRL